MRELVRQAGENDNISTIYVVDQQEQYYGAIELQDLIIAAVNEALRKADADSAAMMSKLTGGLGGGFPF